jgi:hypothetical protein
MADIQNLVARHLEAWNSPPGDDRASQIASVYSEDVFVGEPEAAYTGHGGVEQAISGLQGALPNMTLTLRGDIQTAQDMSTYAWDLGPEGAPGVAHGRDVIVVDGDRISRLYVVIDA